MSKYTHYTYSDFTGTLRKSGLPLRETYSNEEVYMDESVSRVDTISGTLVTNQ